MALINVVKKIEKARSGLGLPADELVVAACTINPKGTMKRGIASGVSGVIGAALAARGDTAVELGAPGLADRFVPGQHAIVLSDRRLFLATLGALTGKPKEIVAEWTRAEVINISVEETKLAYPMTLTFSDSTMVEVEGAKGTDPRSLAI